MKLVKIILKVCWNIVSKYSWKTIHFGKKVLKKYPLDLCTNSFTLASKYNILYRKNGDFDCVTKKRIFLYPKIFILEINIYRRTKND